MYTRIIPLHLTLNFFLEGFKFVVDFYVEFEQDLNLAIERYVSLMYLIRFNSIKSILWSLYDS